MCHSKDGQIAARYLSYLIITGLKIPTEMRCSFVFGNAMSSYPCLIRDVIEIVIKFPRN
jgi:hypothetical protein